MCGILVSEEHTKKMASERSTQEREIADMKAEATQQVAAMRKSANEEITKLKSDSNDQIEAALAEAKRSSPTCASKCPR